MLAKITSKNQVTIPKKIMDQIPDTRYFEVEMRDGAVVLKPLRTYSTSLEAIRSKVKDLFMVIIVLANQTIKQGGQYGSYPTGQRYHHQF